MVAIYEFLAESQLLLLFIFIGVGISFGHIKIKGVAMGAAAVLFTAIGLTAAALAAGVEFHIAKELGYLGLALFAFSIGITSGPNFFHIMRTSSGVVVGLVVVLLAAAGVAYGAGTAMGMDIAVIAGTFAGAITNTPALAAAGAASGDPAAATVGYSIAYLFGVIGMLGFAMLALNKGKNDTDLPSPIVNETVRIDRDDDLTLAQVREQLGDSVQFSRIRRGELGPITNPKETDRLNRDDLLTIVGPTDMIRRAVDFLGHISSHSLRTDRRYLDFRRVTVSNPKLSGRTIAEIDLEGRFGAVISRVRRGDVDMVGEPGLTLLLGDRARVVAPTSKMSEISKFFGDSARGLSDINPIALGLGIALGIALGETAIPLPGGSTFSIGTAAGTLVVGLVMGRVGRIGNITTTLPQTAANVLSELGILVFLAYAGVNAGTKIGTAFSSGEWVQILILGVLVTSTVGAGMYVTMRRLFKMGGTRLSGVLAGSQTQPAVLAFANMRTGADPRVALGYAMVYPVAMIAKILIAQILGGL